MGKIASNKPTVLMVTMMKFTPILMIILLALALPVFSQAPVAPEPAGGVRVVNQIEFTGNAHVSDKNLLDAVGIKPGDLITGAKIECAVEAIQLEYKKHGYLAAVVLPEELVRNFLATGTLRFCIVEGRIEAIRIEGLCKTKESVIRQVLKLRPGDLYSDAALSQDAIRLQVLAIFDSVDASLEPCEAPGRILIIWKLVERKKTGYISLSGSYGPASGLVGIVSAVQGNLRGRAEQLRVIGSVSSIGGRTSIELSYFNPVLTSDTSGSIDAFDAVRYRFTRSLLVAPDLDTYFERRIGGRLGWSRSFSSVRRFSASTRFEHVDVQNLPLESMTPGLTSADGDVASVSAEWLNDTRDSPIYPTSGYYYRGVIEPGWVNQQDGSNGIIRGQVEGRRFKMFGKLNPDCPPKRPPAVLALRVQAGAYAGTLPFFEQFFLGGTHGLRGYLEDRFWGPYLVQATAEYRYPLSRSIAAVAFIDAGDAWGSRWQFVPGTDTDFEQHEGFEPRAGIGVGGRYVGPLGALGLDFAWGEQFLVTLVFGQTF